jgi:hypothetical protein
VLSQRLQESRLIPEHEQLVILRVPQIVNADSARGAVRQIGDFSARVQPPLRIERAVVDRADRLGELLGGDAIQTDHAAPFLAEGCRLPAGG